MVIVFTMIPPISVSAAGLQEAINAIELEPMRETWPFADGVGKALIKRVDDAVKGKDSNYNKLQALYTNIVNDTNLNSVRKQGNNCAAYARELYEAMTVLGFKPYTFRGNITTANGGWTAHSWIGLDIGNTLYFLDPFMTASGNNDYFLLSQKSATMYDLTNTELWQCDIGTGLVANTINLSKLDTSAKRSKYGPVLDMYRETNWLYRTYKSQFEKGGMFENDQYFTTGDKRGNVISVYRDGTMLVETKAEYDTRRDKEFQDWDEQEKRRQWDEKYRDKFGEYDDVFGDAS